MGSTMKTKTEKPQHTPTPFFKSKPFTDPMSYWFLEHGKVVRRYGGGSFASGPYTIEHIRNFWEEAGLLDRVEALDKAIALAEAK